MASGLGEGLLLAARWLAGQTCRDRTPRPPVPQAVVMIDRPLVMAARLEQRLTMGIGLDRAGQGRTGQDTWVAAVYCLLT
jgi:hypothetical protein